jgi:hypothetical protein
MKTKNALLALAAASLLAWGIVGPVSAADEPAAPDGSVAGKPIEPGAGAADPGAGTTDPGAGTAEPGGDSSGGAYPDPSTDPNSGGDSAPGDAGPSDGGGAPAGGNDAPD